MDEARSLSHTKWKCKYHVIFIPKMRRKTLYGQLRKHLGGVSENWRGNARARSKKGHLMPDHVHMMISIPPKYSVSQVVGYIKGKSAIHTARCTESSDVVSWGSISGLGGSSSRRSVETNKVSSR